jgi:SRSO17 transposase
MCPLYVTGLIGPGDRKSVQPMAERLALGDYDQLHHFIAAGAWDATPVETELLVQADRLVGGRDAVLVVDEPRLRRRARIRSALLRNMLRRWARPPIARPWYR